MKKQLWITIITGLIISNLSCVYAKPTTISNEAYFHGEYDSMGNIYVENRTNNTQVYYLINMTDISNSTYHNVPTSNNFFLTPGNVCMVDSQLFSITDKNIVMFLTNAEKTSGVPDKPGLSNYNDQSYSNSIYMTSNFNFATCLTTPGVHNCKYGYDNHGGAIKIGLLNIINPGTIQWTSSIINSNDEISYSSASKDNVIFAQAPDSEQRKYHYTEYLSDTQKEKYTNAEPCSDFLY
jgi:hypothetical protein